MRHYPLLFLLIACLQLQAQPYQISFTGSGLSSSVATVEVWNLTQDSTLTLSGSDTLLLISNPGMDEGALPEGSLRIYPNPAHEIFQVTFLISREGNTIIELLDAGGRPILRHDRALSQGAHVCEIGGLSSGVCLLRVSTPDGILTGQIVSVGSRGGMPLLRYAGMASEATIQPRLASLAGIVPMQYNAGDLLLLKGRSGNYSRVITLVPTQSQTVNFEFIACTDGDGNHYPVVTIGAQTWMAENLKTIRFMNGTVIPIISSDTAWLNLSTGAMCWYSNNEEQYGKVYGGLYNFFAITDTNGLCPFGWHVPTNPDWMQLTSWLGGWTLAGGPLKETTTAHWVSPNAGATNSSGFTALPGGYRDIFTGSFYSIENYGNWWTSTIDLPSQSWSWELGFLNTYFSVGSTIHRYGLSVRCIKD